LQISISVHHWCDAQACTDVICSELDAAGLATSKILRQVYDGATVMSGKHGEVHRLLQERESFVLGQHPSLWIQKATRS